MDEDRSALSVVRGTTACPPSGGQRDGLTSRSYSTDEELRLVVDHIRPLAVPEDLSFLEAIDLNDLLADIPAKGYATREAG